MRFKNNIIKGFTILEDADWALMDFNKTSVFNVAELRQELILLVVNEVIEALEFKGYNPTNQLVGYLTTGDLKYITTFNDS